MAGDGSNATFTLLIILGVDIGSDCPTLWFDDLGCMFLISSVDEEGNIPSLVDEAILVETFKEAALWTWVKFGRSGMEQWKS